MDSLKITKGSSSTSSSPKSSNTNVPVAVRFNAGEECLDDIFKTNHNNGLFKSNSPSPSAGLSSPGGVIIASKPSSVGTAAEIDNVDILRSDNENIYTESIHSLSSSPSQSLQQNNDESNIKSNFLQGNFFSRKSGMPLKQHSKQLSPNNLVPDNAMHIYLEGDRQANSVSSNSSLNGSGGNNMGAISPKLASSQSPSISVSGSTRNTNDSLSPNSNASSSNSSSRYRRSMSFPNKMMGGCSPTNNSNNYANDVHANTTTDAPPAYMPGAPYNNGGGGLQDMRPIDHCLNDIMRNMTSNENMVMAAALVERLRTQKLNEQQQQQQQQQHLSEVDAVAIATGNNSAGVNFLDSALKLNSPARTSPHPPMGGATAAVNLAIVGGSGVGEHSARYSRKVFVGGLPPDIDEDEITSSFRRFGPLVVDWPHKAESKSYFPPKGYAFLLFQDENSVQQLIDACITDDDKLYLCVSSPTIKDKPVQIRPWRLADADYVLDATMSLDPRKTVFVGGVPRPLKAFELAMIMDRLYGGVCYAGIDTDPELKYPKGAGRVAFANQQSYIAAISARFVQLQHGDIDKRVEVKPYVLDDQMCDECEGQRCSGKFAPFFCANVTCLQYYCEHCWAVIHSRPGREYHKPLVKEGADRPRAVPFRWC